MTAVLVLAGPTASGKTELAIELALACDAEIVNADSRQIYRGMPIGTAAPSAAQLARVPHHLVGFLDPHERYSAARFVDDALAAIARIAARGRRAIVAGGTGFYVRALCGDIAVAGEFDPAVRARLDAEARLHPPEVLHDWLGTRDPARAATVPPADTYRIVRALEIALTRSGAVRAAAPAQPRSERANLRTQQIPFRKLGLAVADDELDARIAARIDAMLADGFTAEAERIGADAVAADAVGYPQALAYLGGLATPAEFRAALVRATRRYAKRQRTWFRSEPGLERVDREHAMRAARELWGVR